jgi:thioredoxin 1
MNSPIEIPYLSDIDLKKAISSLIGLVLVLFVEDGNGICYLMESSLNKLPVDIRSRISIFKMEYKTNQESLLIYSIQNTPSLLFFNKGQLVDKMVGLFSKKELISRIQLNL